MSDFDMMLESPWRNRFNAEETPIEETIPLKDIWDNEEDIMEEDRVFFDTDDDERFYD